MDFNKLNYQLFKYQLGYQNNLSVLNSIYIMDKL